MDQVVRKFVGSELTSSSKKGLISKYNYAKGKIQEMMDDGVVGYHCAVTYQKIRTDASDESVMRTIVQCDGLGRITTKAPATLCRKPTP